MLIEITDVMPGPPETVWALITDWEHQDDWMLEASDFVVTSDRRDGLGVEAEATVKIGGIKVRDRVRVIGWEPALRLTIEHLGWVRGTGDIQLSSRPDGQTGLQWREDLSLPSLGSLGTLGLRLFEPIMRRTFRRDLRILRGLVRARVHGS